MTHFRSWWFREPGFTNFGDELGAVFLSLLGHEVERVPFEDAEILTTGSILQRHNRAPLRAGTILWGTGWHRAPLRSRPELDVRAVRGSLTAAALGLEGVPLGDPGLLASHFWPAGPKEHRVGWVPHYIDDRELPDTYRIDVRADPETVCRQIASCETVIASSLHGCIVAASYGIPYMRLPHPRVVGGDTKWIDFATSLTRPISKIQQQLLEGIADL